MANPNVDGYIKPLITGKISENAKKNNNGLKT